jgi:P-type E1-E2 ATPase
VDGRRVAVGSTGWLEEQGYDAVRAHSDAALGEENGAGRARILVGVDGVLEGVIVMADHLRPGADRIADELREAGVERVALVSGDRLDVAREVAASLGIDEVYAEQDPADKLRVVDDVRSRTSGALLMAGDGINDAPALALADVGLAMAGKGATVSSEAADVVVVVDRADRIPLAVRVGRRSLHIARQSVVAGLALSVGAMGVAALGYLAPVWGALFQEVIDVAVILNALRAVRG